MWARSAFRPSHIDHIGVRGSPSRLGTAAFCTISWAMIRFAFRLLGYVLVALGFALLVIDGTTSIASGALVLTSFGDALVKAVPDAFGEAKLFIETKLDPDAWRMLQASLMAAPAFGVLMLAGLISAALGRRPRPAIGFAPLR